MTTKKLVIAAPPLPGIASSVAGGFEAIGWETLLFEYPLVKGSLLRRLLRVDTEAERRRFFNELLRVRVLPEIRRSPPGLLLILKGADPDPATRKQMEEVPCPILLWTFDSLARIPGQSGISDLCAHRFFMDGGDVRDPATDHWLPLGFDPAHYHPRSSPPDHDILFIGRMGGNYRRRREALIEVSRSSLPGRCRIGVIGSTGSSWADRSLGLDPRIDWAAKHLPPERYGEAIARSRICVNVHQDDGARPVNPSFFAVPGTGACQVAEDLPHLGHWLDRNRNYVPFARGELAETLLSLLQDEERRKTVAAGGRRAASESHTYRHRAQAIVRTVFGDRHG